MQINSRVQDFILALQETGSQDRAADASREMAERAGVRVFQVLRAIGPRPTPSKTPAIDPPRHTRVAHEPIHTGWVPPIVLRQTGHGSGGASMRIFNRSEHMDVQRYGRAPNTVVNWQVFWMRPDKIRDPGIRRRMEARVRQGKEPLIRLLYTRRREPLPPWGGSDFVERAAQMIRPGLQSMFHRTAVDVAWRPLREFFGR